MNENDHAYYVGKEIDHNAEQQRRALADLRDNGVRIRMRSNAGSVAVNAFGVVTDVRLDEKNAAFMAERTLAGYVVEALAAAEKQARTKRDEILARKLGVS